MLIFWGCANIYFEQIRTYLYKINVAFWTDDTLTILKWERKVLSDHSLLMC